MGSFIGSFRASFQGSFMGSFKGTPTGALLLWPWGEEGLEKRRSGSFIALGVPESEGPW